MLGKAKKKKKTGSRSVGLTEFINVITLVFDDEPFYGPVSGLPGRWLAASRRPWRLQGHCFYQKNEAAA